MIYWNGFRESEIRSMALKGAWAIEKLDSLVALGLRRWRDNYKECGGPSHALRIALDMEGRRKNGSN